MSSNTRSFANRCTVSASSSSCRINPMDILEDNQHGPQRRQPLQLL